MLRHLKFLLPAIGDNEARGNLKWIKCSTDSGFLYMTATNGYMIKTAKISIPGNQLADGLTFYINRSAVEKTIKLADNDPQVILILPYKFKIGSSSEINFKKFGSNYPDLSPIINSNEKMELGQVDFGSDLMIKCLENSDGLPSSKVKIDFIRNLDPIPPTIIRIDFMNSMYMAYLLPSAFPCAD